MSSTKPARYFSLTSELFPNQLVSDLVIESRSLSDVTLVADDAFQSEFPAHKAILSSCSETFKTLLLSSPDAQPRVHLQGVSKQDLKLLIDFIYSGKITGPPERLLHFSQTLQFKDDVRSSLNNVAGKTVQKKKKNHSSKFKPEDKDEMQEDSAKSGKVIDSKKKGLKSKISTKKPLKNTQQDKSKKKSKSKDDTKKTEIILSPKDTKLNLTEECVAETKFIIDYNPDVFLDIQSVNPDDVDNLSLVETPAPSKNTNVVGTGKNLKSEGVSMNVSEIYDEFSSKVTDEVEKSGENKSQKSNVLKPQKKIINVGSNEFANLKAPIISELKSTEPAVPKPKAPEVPLEKCPECDLKVRHISMLKHHIESRHYKLYRDIYILRKFDLNSLMNNNKDKF